MAAAAEVSGRQSVAKILRAIDALHPIDHDQLVEALSDLGMLSTHECAEKHCDDGDCPDQECEHCTDCTCKCHGKDKPKDKPADV